VQALSRAKKWDLPALYAVASIVSDRTFDARHPASDPKALRVFYERAFEHRPPKRPADYYLAAWGAAPGLPDDTVIALSGEKKYETNPHLDLRGEGKIRVRALSLMVEGRMLEIGKLPGTPKPFGLFDVISTIGLIVLRARVGL